MRYLFEKICLIYTALFMMVASVPRCDLILDAMAIANQAYSDEACHDDEGSSDAACQCQVHFAYLCLPDQLDQSFVISLESYPMVDTAALSAIPVNHIGDINIPPPKYS